MDKKFTPEERKFLNNHMRFLLIFCGISAMVLGGFVVWVMDSSGYTICGGCIVLIAAIYGILVIRHAIKNKNFLKD